MGLLATRSSLLATPKKAVTDFAFGKCSKKCWVSGQPLAPGEAYYSVVVPDGHDLQRRDISLAAWTGAPEGAIGWWRCRMPDATAKKLQPAPVGVLLDTLTELQQRPGSETLAYLLALLLCRRRVLVDSDAVESGSGDDADGELVGQSTSSLWTLTYPPDGREWAVPVAVPDPNLLENLQTQLHGLLFTEV